MVLSCWVSYNRNETKCPNFLKASEKGVKSYAQKNKINKHIEQRCKIEVIMNKPSNRSG